MSLAKQPIHKEVSQRQSCFQPGSTLCVGCMESTIFQNVGKTTDNGKKTIYTMGTFCGEVSTLNWPNVVAWGRGDQDPSTFEKSFSIIHNVFESAPSVAEAIKDTADTLFELGAMKKEVQVVSNSGDGGALVIGLRTLLHTINRRANITIVCLINEFFANTGFQYAVTATPYSETSTTPAGDFNPGNLNDPMNYIGMCLMAGAGFVAQISPAFPKDFAEVSQMALEHPETSVIFVPSPCISGWKYEEGRTMELAKLAAQSGLFPTFIKEKGKAGAVKHVASDAKRAETVGQFLAAQRRFNHLIREDKDGKPVIRPGHEKEVERIIAWTHKNVRQLQSLAKWDVVEA